MGELDPVLVFKALSNETRLHMLAWLKEPEENFPKKEAHLPHEVNEKRGVCVGDIQEKSKLSQSTVSNYLSMLQKAGLLESERYGQWTYYRRNEEAVQQLSKFIETEL
ncbi:ArsR family transcriptional regulator [Pontibacillus halophilus JSM 076056 = DSM 19796]|uniref:ArsR family transcriptional regulator n=1 Tax=Pontibacillus halophilus JSM 076056 = DSM 19796 TaxID=1385510 RepID=A0A0A5GIT6_9BACI|nr:metalloregulator ArsR/SmtB family transcription factor [Pontibacillus halophilus]KGX91138.1 ArsR family transcriptional regulator [Pontibacillus halophilus JSM 076056 = DSM 19796]